MDGTGIITAIGNSECIELLSLYVTRSYMMWSINSMALQCMSTPSSFLLLVCRRMVILILLTINCFTNVTQLKTNIRKCWTYCTHVITLYGLYRSKQNYVVCIMYTKSAIVHFDQPIKCTPRLKNSRVILF